MTNFKYQMTNEMTNFKFQMSKIWFFDFQFDI